MISPASPATRFRSRRSSRCVTGVTLAAALLVAACGSNDGAATDTASDSTVPPPAAAAFPVTVDTAFGQVTVEDEPQRIVALGWGDAETALALGVQPVGAADWLGFGGEGVGPWAEGLYDQAPEIIDAVELTYEAIAALDPDLILDVRGDGDAERYELLSEIAPTIGVPDGGESFLTTQPQQVTMIAQALGRADLGQRLLDDIDTAFATVSGDHPDWEGQSVSAATRFGDVWGAYVDGEGRLEFLKRLGFVQNPAIADLDASGGFYVEISEEQIGVIDADLIVAFPIGLPATEITESPIFQQIPAAVDGRFVVIDGDLSAAYSLNTTLSAAYALEALVPLIDAALS